MRRVDRERSEEAGGGGRRLGQERRAHSRGEPIHLAVSLGTYLRAEPADIGGPGGRSSSLPRGQTNCRWTVQTRGSVSRRLDETSGLLVEVRTLLPREDRRSRIEGRDTLGLRRLGDKCAG
ncbi:hypothetical protein KM043_003550 [Ampulex compressa]|nr:hypothetical protein KM043_003550 [Ampulex compressa]